MTAGAPSPRPRPASNSSSNPVEIWGGIECTVNRVGDRYYDQIALTGHADRTIADLERFAEFGVRTLRYPVLWERIAPYSLDHADWFQTDLAFAKMRELGIKPIVGLVHHGSGPKHTSLIDRDFPRKLGEFASAVAHRYPWVEMWTPINEPLTTARFSTLYGHWYPHARDDRSFARAVINQCAAIREAMAAIRAVNPKALLVQTEDLGKTYSTPALDYQAKFDNNRRWLTFDLLAGRLGEWNRLWWYLLESGIERHELESFLAQPCIPDILGINHYVTSDRYLDDSIEHYPAHCCGGNGRQEYADVEAVRTLEEGITGHAGVLRETWNRYALPLAITEVHLGCTRDEQLRWLNEAWRAARDARAEYIDVRAITVWSLLGGYGWCSLLTDDFACYESGAFDLRSARPRPTAIAQMTRGLSTTGDWDHPVLDTSGWWRRETRFMYKRREAQMHSGQRTLPSRVILVTGCNGTLGRAFQRIAKARGLAYHAVGRRHFDITRSDSVARVLKEIKPWAVINGAGYVRVDDAEEERASCFQVNTEGASMLAEQCAKLGIQFAAFSSDLVFDGSKGQPYIESDATCPLNVYGASKARLEQQLREIPHALVIRTSAFFGPWDQHNFLATTLKELTNGRPVTAANDTIVSPTYVPDLVNTALDLIIDGECGIWHLANRGAVTWHELATRAAARVGLDSALVTGKPMAQLGARAKKPVNSALSSERGTLMPDLDDALDRWCAAIKSKQTQPVEVEIGSSV
ncbi:MAG TPA: family 1 glycosylhydrolase [Gemmatimonadaceae bacterium]|nr:family 1 glycosylhydrolase [Gemmatimonadaceae bacterium]